MRGWSEDGQRGVQDAPSLCLGTVGGCGALAAMRRPGEGGAGEKTGEELGDPLTSSLDSPCSSIRLLPSPPAWAALQL